MKTTFTTLLVLLPLLGFSQIINSNETTIAEFYDGVVNTIELNGSKVSGQFLAWSPKWIYAKGEDRSAIKNNSFFVNVGLTNTGQNILNLGKFDFKKNNGLILGITFQHSFDKIYLVDEINNPFSLKAFTIGINYQFDKFKNYDPVTQKIITATPDKVILKGGFSYYYFHYKKDAKRKYSVVPTLFSTINLKDYNKTKLQNYLLSDNSTIDNVVFTKNSNFDGKYGVIVNNLKSAQIGFSMPVVPEKFSKYLPVISPIPYISYEVFDQDKPRLNGGIALGFLASSLIDKDTQKDADGYDYRKFKVPSYITLGVDWNYQNGQGSKPNYFIAGSIKL